MAARPVLNGAVDIRAILHSLYAFIKKRPGQDCPGPVDSPVLRMHYRWTLYFLLGGFMTVWYGWYFGQIIHCVNTFSGDKPARSDYENICLSYPFVQDGNKRRNILFYRWVHWTFLMLAAVFYVPRTISKSLESPKCKKILQDLSALNPRYDQGEKEAVQRATHYMRVNFKTHNGLYWKCVAVHVSALIIDISVLLFLDFILHNRFIYFVPKAYPFTRNMTDFSDYISQTFPPFASCILNENHKILHGREEIIGCHLTNMELYEKLFFILWFMIYMLIISTTVYLIFLLLMLLPSTSKYYLRTAKPMDCSESVEKIINRVASMSKVGDIYMLYRIKHHMNHMRFCELLAILSDRPVLDQLAQKPTDIQIKHNSALIHHANPGYETNESIRHRDVQKNKSEVPKPNETYLRQILIDPQTAISVMKPPKLPTEGHPPKNTSILIE